MQQLRSFEAFLLVLGLLLLAGAGVCGLIGKLVPGSDASGGFAIAGGLCFVAAAIMYTKTDAKKPSPTEQAERHEAGPPETDIRTGPQ
jgi:hypothetical protein